MKKLLTYFKNLDNDQKAVLKSAGLIVSVVLIASITMGAYMAILAIPLHFMVTSFFSTDIKRKKQYILDTKSKKKFKLATTERFVYGWFFLVVVTFVIFQYLTEYPVIAPLVLLAPSIVINAIAFRLKLPLSAISLRSLPGSSSVNTQSQFDSTPIRSCFPEMGDAVQDPAFSSSPSNIYHVPTPRRD